jgi:hypothetical protein
VQLPPTAAERGSYTLLFPVEGMRLLCNIVLALLQGAGQCAFLLLCYVRRMSPLSTGCVAAFTDQLMRYLNQYITPTAVCAAPLLCSGRRMSPWSTGRAVASTDQLNRYLAQYATPTMPQQPQEQPTPETGPMGSGFGGMYGDAADQGLPPSPALPMGRDAPAYRPSLVSRKSMRAHTCLSWVYMHTKLRAALKVIAPFLPAVL